MSKAQTLDTAKPRSPFAFSTFTVIWLATVLSNIGGWIHDVGAGWLMTSLSPSPLLVALVQAATSLPVFLLSLPAGALADILDRRKWLLGVQIYVCLVALCLGCLVLFGLINPWVLLFFTLLMGTGTAMASPAWQAIVPSLVPRSSLQPAIALNSVGVNISRAIGPALAGVIITTLGIAAPFFVNAASFLLVTAALIWWRPPPKKANSLPPEHLLGGMLAGLRFALHNGPLKATLVRAVSFFLFASAYWALLPLIARTVLNGGVELYGIMLGCIGVGAVAAAFILPKLRAVLSADKLVAAGTLGTAVTMLVLATVHNAVWACLICLLAGISWIAVLTSLNVSAQTSLPDWVRARGLAVFVTVFFGSQSLGSIIWGQTAATLSIPTALLLAAAGALLFIPLTWRWKLQQGAELELSPSMHWDEPLLSKEVQHDRGPVMITIEYNIDPQQGPAFIKAMYELSQERRRDGAYAWGLYEDSAQPGHWLEYFLVASWLEHLRQHQRVTKADQDIQAGALAFHIGPQAPKITHYLAADLRDKSDRDAAIMAADSEVH